MSTAIQTLKEKLTPEYMKPIMALQGSALGFKTDKDLNPDKSKGQGYPMDVVKDCLIDAVLLGLSATGNEFNIIGGNMYPTRQGFGSLLEKEPGLKYNLTYKMPTINSDQKTANCIVTIDWEFAGEKHQQVIDFPIKSNAYATADALIGKAERKARRWLYNKIKGTDIPDGDISDIPHEVVVSKKLNPEKVSENKEAERVKTHIAASKDFGNLEKCVKAIRDEDKDLWALFVEKAIEISTTADELKKYASKIPDDNPDLLVRYDDKKRELSKTGK
jgi:hypothetical protein